MPASDFNDRELVAGSLTGIRRFAVDSLGRLTGVTNPAVWKPGINEASCGGVAQSMASMQRALNYSVRSLHAAYYGVDGPVEPSDPEPERPKHQVAGKGCSCGYYAFFEYDAENHGYGRGDVTGIVEATGVATVGSKGFRAEKAEVVALVQPKRRECKRRKVDALAWWLSGHPSEGILAGLAISLGLIVAVASVALAGSTSLWFLLGLIVPAFCGWVAWSDFRSLDLTLEKRRRAGIPEHGEPRSAPWALIRRNYPDVPVYDSVEAALAAHPLSEPPAKPVIAPDTVDDFWTRSAS